MTIFSNINLAFSMTKDKDLNLSEKSSNIQKMFDAIAPRYDILNRILSFAQDIRWRNALIKELKKETSGVLYDVACGTGDVMIAAQEKRKDYDSFHGFDISTKMLTRGEMRTKNISKKISFTLASAESLPCLNESCDSLSIAFGLRNVDKREKALKEFQRVLKPSGHCLILEFFPLRNPVFAKCLNLYMHKILPFVGGLFSDKKAYTYLPNSVNSMPYFDDFLKKVEKEGFQVIKTKSWLFGYVCLIVAQKCD